MALEFGLAFNSQFNKLENKKLSVDFLLDNTPPGLNPIKGLYLVKDLKRTFEFYKIGPIKFQEVGGIITSQKFWKNKLFKTIILYFRNLLK